MVFLLLAFFFHDLFTLNLFLPNLFSLKRLTLLSLLFATLKTRITSKAHALGFDTIGFTQAMLDLSCQQHLRCFIREGRYGTMDWLANRVEQRSAPQGLWPEAISIISLGTNYGPPYNPLEFLQYKEKGLISAYAQNRDYHDVVKGRLKELGQFILKMARQHHHPILPNHHHLTPGLTPANPQKPSLLDYSPLPMGPRPPADSAPLSPQALAQPRTTLPPMKKPSEKASGKASRKTSGKPSQPLLSRSSPEFKASPLFLPPTPQGASHEPPQGTPQGVLQGVVPQRVLQELPQASALNSTPNSPQSNAQSSAQSNTQSHTQGNVQRSAQSGIQSSIQNGAQKKNSAQKNSPNNSSKIPPQKHQESPLKSLQETPRKRSQGETQKREAQKEAPQGGLPKLLWEDPPQNTEHLAPPSRPSYGPEQSSELFSGLSSKQSSGPFSESFSGSSFEPSSPHDPHLQNPRLKVFVDTAPVMEKPLAQQAGLGWQGKHTNLVSRQFGSWLFLGEIYTTLPLPPDQPHSNHCGSCQSCMDICPTQAITAPYQLDARLCISYLTIEFAGLIPHHLRPAIGNRIYGCDDCLAVCPWNRFAQATQHAKLQGRPELLAPDLGFLIAFDEETFRRFFSGNPIKRIGHKRFLRNVLLGIGNSGQPHLLEKARKFTHHPDPILAEMAQWSVFQLEHLPFHSQQNDTQ
ncbi:Epoxyqueuosine reductase [Entomobacter blattae]|uniref:Epoxyqueuosine reductase n=1 Tax=Entomobacter blattae TaxID=2762277 RepID=A0A7H1NR10_9PROT|nr:Epoxyqueuosine reductase [Entomobacter blattae]